MPTVEFRGEVVTVVSYEDGEYSMVSEVVRGLELAAYQIGRADAIWMSIHGGIIIRVYMADTLIAAINVDKDGRSVEWIFTQFLEVRGQDNVSYILKISDDGQPTFRPALRPKIIELTPSERSALGGETVEF